jgi:CheY-like chemotaxis protein
MDEIGPENFQFANEIVSKTLRTRRGSRRDKNLESTKPTILVVDDQRMIADTTAEVLNQSGFRASRTYSGHSALEMARKLKPDYLLTDVLMPGMNGVELAIEVASELPTTKIVLFSGQAGITDILHRARDKGYVFELLSKPIHPERLVEHLWRKR